MKTSFYAPTVSVVCRWFQAGCECPDPKQNGVIKEFNWNDFEARLAQPLAHFMRTAGSDVKSVTIVSHGDHRFGSGEAIGADGQTATTRAIRQSFSNEIASGFLRTVIDTEWGNNAGSAHALNIGWELATKIDRTSHVLSWNPELQMTGWILARMLAHMERHALDFVGAYRQGYWRLYQWQLAQNTACLYPIETLCNLNGFSDENCDGNDRATIEVPGIGKVTLAGMDDFDLALRFAKAFDQIPRWGMVGRADPFLWDINFAPNSDRAKLLQAKIARQPIVMEKWVERHFPGVPYHDFMDSFFAHRHED